MSHNQTLEINPSHPLIIKMNELRKVDTSRASRVSKQLLDSILVQSAIPHDMQKSAERNLDMLDDYLKMKI